MNKDQYSDQLEQLLKDKDASALTPEEQALVIRELGSTERFARMRKIAANSQRAFGQEKISPSSAVLGNILSRVGLPDQPKQVKYAFYQHPLPLYQAAAAIVLAIGLTWWWAQSRQVMSPEPVLITLVDTVYQEVFRVDTIQVESPSKVKHALASTKTSQSIETSSNSIASAINSAADFRFSRGEFPVRSARRMGKNWHDHQVPFTQDSVPSHGHLFATDRML